MVPEQGSRVPPTVFLEYVVVGTQVLKKHDLAFRNQITLFLFINHVFYKGGYVIFDNCPGVIPLDQHLQPLVCLVKIIKTTTPGGNYLVPFYESLGLTPVYPGDLDWIFVDINGTE